MGRARSLATSRHFSPFAMWLVLSLWHFPWGCPRSPLATLTTNAHCCAWGVRTFLLPKASNHLTSDLILAKKWTFVKKKTASPWDPRIAHLGSMRSSRRAVQRTVTCKSGDRLPALVAHGRDHATRVYHPDGGGKTSALEIFYRGTPTRPRMHRTAQGPQATISHNSAVTAVHNHAINMGVMSTP